MPRDDMDPTERVLEHRLGATKTELTPGEQRLLDWVKRQPARFPAPITKEIEELLYRRIPRLTKVGRGQADALRQRVLDLGIDLPRDAIVAP